MVLHDKAVHIKFNKVFYAKQTLSRIKKERNKMSSSLLKEKRFSLQIEILYPGHNLSSATRTIVQQ
jgi:hypothetical protein